VPVVCVHSPGAAGDMPPIRTGKQSSQQGNQTMNEQESATPGDGASPGAGRQVRLHIDDRNMTSAYANGFRTNVTAEEVIVDFGMNLAVPQRAREEQKEPVTGEMVFTIQNRVILNYYTAKRLAMSLGQVVRRHEEQFGALELNPAARRRNA
jgi:hypothetical protein